MRGGDITFPWALWNYCHSLLLYGILRVLRQNVASHNVSVTYRNITKHKSLRITYTTNHANSNFGAEYAVKKSCALTENTEYDTWLFKHAFPS